MSKTLRRTVALLLSIMLMITAIPFTVYADDDETIDTEDTEIMDTEEDEDQEEEDLPSDDEDQEEADEETDSGDDQDDQDSDSSFPDGDVDIIETGLEWPDDDPDLDEDSDTDLEDWYLDYIDEPADDPVDGTETGTESEDEEPDTSAEPEKPAEKPEKPPKDPEKDHAANDFEEYLWSYYDGSLLKYLIYEQGHAYFMTDRPMKVYHGADQKDEDHFFTLTEEGTILLATEFAEQWNWIGIRVWFISPSLEVMTGYVDFRALPEDLAVLTEEEAVSQTSERDYAWVNTGEEEQIVFVAAGEKVVITPIVPMEQAPVQQEQPAIIPDQPETTTGTDPSDTEEKQEPEEKDPAIQDESSADIGVSADDPVETETPAGEPAAQEPESKEQGKEEAVSEKPETQEPVDKTDKPEDEPLSGGQEEPETPEEDQPEEPEKKEAETGDYLAVTKDTRVFLEASEESYAGNFVNDATVQIADICENKEGIWYSVYYLYGDTLVDGSVKWSEIGTVYILADEAQEADSDELTMTDYALTAAPVRRNALRAAAKSASTTPMNGFTLKKIHVDLPTLHAGQTGVHGSSGKDSDYPQIASLAGHGAIYATPHYLDGWTVYCLEHTYDGPGEGSGSNQTPTGPYVIVDIDTYLNTPGQSGIIFSYKTMHAIAWVIRHSYPFMALDRSDANNITWSRVAGQFAIRQVIREMEGSQYVRSYWNMDNFYVASGQAPSVYLEYARWLATNGIARGQITGKIKVSDKSVVKSGDSYIGTVTLTTDADYIRIAKSSSYTITGNGAGDDSSYYFLNSEDTIQITCSVNGFTITAESINSDAEEASFLVGVPSANIQKVIIPVEGYPYPMKDKEISFEVVTQYGDLTVTKRRDRGDQRVLAGATFQLYNASSQPVGSPVTTGADGIASWTGLEYGTYYLQETAAPAGYQLDSSMVTIGIDSASVTYTANDPPIIGSVKVIKKENGKSIPLMGAKYELVTKSGSSYTGAVSVVDGSTLPVLTTDSNGEAVWQNVVEQGDYYVHEVQAPEGYLIDNEYYAVNVSAANTIVSKDVTDQVITGKIKIVKKDQLTQEPLAGAEFTVTRLSAPPSYNGAGVGEVVAVLTTDANGNAETDWLIYGKYKVEETKVPAHFVDNHYSTVIEAYENGKTYTVTVDNEPTKGYIKLVKTDKLDRCPIEGVQFDIYYNDQYGTGLAGTMTTNADGVAVSPALRKGKYIVKEHANPTGYTSELLEFDPVVVKSDETTNISGTDTPVQGRIRIIKKDQLTKEALAGAEFTVTRISGLPSHKGSNDGEVVAVITTDADGIAVTPLLTWGTYKVEETKVPVHFVDNHYSTEVVIDTEDLKTYEIEVENEPTKGWIRLTKKDRKNDNGIAGVQFDIYYNDQYGEGLATTMVTDETGVAMSEPIRKGKYIVKEHGTTAGYLFEEVMINCTVKSDEITDVSATNLPVQVKLRLYKRDKDEYTGNPEDAPGTRGDGVLTGAVFQIIAGENITDRQGNILYRKGEIVVASLKTAGADASVITDELWPGVYELVELTPPTGYQSSDAHVRIDATSAALQSEEAVITYVGVKTNEILYGKYGFVKFLGDNEIHDDAGIIEEPEKGAVFEVYLKSAGSYDTARSFERDKITTDKYGKAETKMLPYGVYTVKQIKGKAGYAIKSPFDIFINGTEDPQNPPSFIVNNEAVRYRLKFIKEDAETGRTITVANTAFKLKDANGEYVTQTVHYPSKKTIATFYTDEDGTVMLPETVRRGLYFIEEFKAPEGYLIRTEELAVFVGDENMNEPGEAYLLEFTIKDEPVKGRIKLEKTGLQLTGFKEKEDRFGNTIMRPVYEEKRLAGAVFEIHAAEDITGKDGTEWYKQDDLVGTITTTADGEDISGELPLGRYYLIEISAPEGYVFPDTRYEAELAYADDHTPLVEITVTAGNDFIPSEINLYKEKEITAIQQDGSFIRQVITNAPGEGFVFGLYNDTDIHYANGTLLADTLMAEGTTGADGTLTFEGYYPHGRYYIRELAAPDRWKLNTETFCIETKPADMATDQKIHVSVDKVHDELIWYPVTLTKTDITGEHTIPGALIEVTDANGEVIYRAETDRNGEIPNIPVIPGKYTFREILAPSGYALNEAVMTFTVDEHGGITGDTTIRDDFTRVLLLKHDENGRPLAGVEFSLIRSDGKTIMTARSDAEGQILFEKIPYGSYTIEETKTLAGYQKHDVKIELTVDGRFINQDKPIETVVNYPIIVKLKKVDQDGNILPGAEYALINEFGEQMMTAVSDANGIITFERVPYGKYKVKELSAPEGYLLSKEITEITIDDSYRNSETPVATLVNHLKRIKYIKVDTSGKYLPGVEFSLINASTGEVAETVTSNEKGEFIFTKFDYGFWKIEETKVPEGFSKMKDITLNVDSDWTEPAPFTCVNIPNVYEFVKADNEGNPMEGVRFNLEDTEGNALRELVSVENGLVTVDNLEPGTYVIRETETLEGFTVSGETIEIVIDENYVVANELPVFVNYPEIQTGVDFEITPVMYAGGAVMLIGLIAMIWAAFKSRKSRKKHRRNKR